MPSFLEGFASKLGGTIDEFTQNKLKMAMLSKQIEMEANARMAEQQQQHELNLVPGEQVAGLAKMMGATGDTSALSGMQLPGSVAGAALQGIGMGNRIPQFTPVNTGEDAMGRKTYAVFNKKTNSWENAPMGNFSPKASDEISTARASATEMSGIINLVDKNVKGLITAAGAEGLPEQLARNKINQYLQNDAGAMKAYKDTIASHNTRFEYALSHNPRLASQIQQAAGSQFGDPLADIGPTWDKKRQMLQDLVANSERSVLAAHGVQPIEDTTNHFNAGFNAGTNAASQAAEDQYLKHINDVINSRKQTK